MADRTEASQSEAASGQPPDNPADGAPIVASAVQSTGAAGSVLSVKYLTDKLEEAELLLGYAAEVGIKVEDDVHEGILQARAALGAGGFSEQTATKLLTALTTLAVNVRPVTVESLRFCADPKKAGEARETIRVYGCTAIVVGFIIVVISPITFVSDSLSQKITADVDTANALAAKLRVELGAAPPSDQTCSNAANLPQDQVWFGTNGPPQGLSEKDIISDLAQFAGTMRQINGYARQLKRCLFDFEPGKFDLALASQTNRDPLELTPGLPVRLSQELTDKVEVYQKVRAIANQVQEKVTVYYGAIATCFLPVLYALLGAGAYLLRLYEEQINSRTFVGGNRHISRFLIAGIGGLVVGQFNVGQGATISPFAVAFLVGYALDVFFAFLDGLLQMFKRTPGGSGVGGSTSKQ